MQKKYLRTIIAGVVVMAVVVGGGYVWKIHSFNQEEDLEGVDANNEVEVEEWSLYRNNQYDFEIRYPEQWQIKEIPTENIYTDYFTGPSPIFRMELLNAYGGDTGIFLDIYSALGFRKGERTVGTRKEDIVFEGKRGYKYTRKEAPDIGGPDIVITIEVPHDDKIFEINYVRESYRSSYEDTFNQILDSFEFL